MFFKKLKFRFIDESATVEYVRFPYKMTLSKANVFTDGMRSKKLILLPRRDD